MFRTRAARRALEALTMGFSWREATALGMGEDLADVRTRTLQALAFASGASRRR